MGKKKKSKDTVSVADKNIKILKSGKIKVKKGQKISLEPYVEESAKNVICSRLDAIISKEDVIVDASNCRLDVNTTLSSMKRTVELVTRMDTPVVYTMVHIISKKDATDIFDFLDDSVVGGLLRSSTLAAIYKKVKSDWVELNEKDNTNFTNVLYIPKILVFLDERTGEIRRRPYSVNLLLVVEPSLKAMAEGVEKVSEEDASKRMISDTYEAAIKCAAKNLIINPYCHKLLVSDEHYTAENWHAMSEVQRSIEGLNTIDFTVNGDDAYIIFAKSKKN